MQDHSAAAKSCLYSSTADSAALHVHHLLLRFPPRLLPYIFVPKEAAARRLVFGRAVPVVGGNVVAESRVALFLLHFAAAQKVALVLGLVVGRTGGSICA